MCIRDRVKTGAVSDMAGFSVIPYYVSELSDEIRIAETKSGKLPERGNEIAVQAAMLKKMGIPIQIGSQITLDFCDGNSETFTVTGILSGGETAKRFAVFFSKSYADSGSQLKDMPYEVYAKPVSYTHLDVYKRQLLGRRHDHLARVKSLMRESQPADLTKLD